MVTTGAIATVLPSCARRLGGRARLGYLLVPVACPHRAAGLCLSPWPADRVVRPARPQGPDWFSLGSCGIRARELWPFPSAVTARAETTAL